MLIWLFRIRMTLAGIIAAKALYGAVILLSM